MNRDWNPRLLTALKIGTPVVLIALWWVLSAGSKNFFFPPLSKILDAFASTWLGPVFASDVLPSLARLAVGYLLALVIGIGLGSVIGTWPRVRQFIEPVLEFFRAIPVPVLVPILMLFAGIGDTMKIIVVAIGAVWPVLLNTIEGVRGVDEVLHETSTVYRMSRRRRITHLVLPGASPQIMAGARQALSLAIIVMVISEMFAASNGLGFKILQFQQNFAIAEMWSGVLLLGLVGVVLASLFRVVEAVVLRWHEGIRKAERN
ncbi:ABC transporter permease [Enemella sp. A6]|uniref:ABC transporter permease n=1 Tax=Enemella sp. A6 TaxID=3440152 RepID=UPI003EB982F2